MQNSSIFTTLKMVADLNRCFGNKPWHEIAGDKNTYHSYLNGQVSLIIEEMYEELGDAVKAGDVDLTAMLDAIGDSITVIDGLAHKAGLESFIAEHCDVVAFLQKAPPVPFHIKEFQNIPQYVHDQEIGRLAFELWRWHRTFIEAFSIEWGFDPLKVYKEVHESNMSKFCSNRGEVAATLDKYSTQYGLSSVVFTEGYESGKTDLLVVNPALDLRVEEVNGIYVIKTNREIKMGEKVVKAGKFLKGINFKEPDFSEPARFTFNSMVLPTL